MAQTNIIALHDEYAADYDRQVQDYNCQIGDLLFGLCYEYTQPGNVLLDAGVGTGLSAQPFAKAGLDIFGMDFSPAMLEICRAKGLLAGLRQHDIQQVPWPYLTESFDFVVCCGVLHFIQEIENIFFEAKRVLREGGVYAFTTRVVGTDSMQDYSQQSIGGFEIFSHSPAYLKKLLTISAFKQLKIQKCFVSEEMYLLWVVQKEIP
jgi:predicted TPR repeat methyltransferase